MQFDYRELLIKYMAHVGAYEGTYFIPRYCTEGFFDDEISELIAIADEADLRYIES